MSFVAQVRLEEATPFDLEKHLPRTGLLSFYYDSTQQTFGADPTDRDGWAVLYLTGEPALWQPRPFPTDLSTQARYQPAAISFQTEWTFPSAPGKINTRLGWSQDEILQYENWLVDRLPAAERTIPRHRMLGYPDQIQDDMQLESALASHGFTSLNQPGAKKAADNKADWCLLLQVDSDTTTGMRWGSAGTLYYWIENAKLKAGRFDHTWLVLQSD